MKKLLTAAAFLAAGTALSNAATVVAPSAAFNTLDSLMQQVTNGTDTWGFYTASSAANVAPTFSDGAATFSGGTDVLYLWKNASTYGNTSNTRDNITMSSSTITMVVSGVSAGGNSGNSVNALFSYGNNWGLSVVSTDNNTYLTGLWNSAVWNNATNNKQIDITGKDSFILTVCMDSHDGNNGTSIYIDGQFVDHINGLYSTSSTANQITIGNLSSGSKGSNFTLSGLYVHNQALTETQVGDFVSSIPEPSAFGLLAGIGALALVAARRRRK